MNPMNHGHRLLAKCGRKRAERQFLEAILAAHPQVAENLLVPGVGYVGYQFREPPYLIDVAIIGERARIAVEIDEGHHRLWLSRSRDQKRQLDLADAGWDVIRFSEKSIRSDAAACVAKAFRLARRWNVSTPADPNPEAKHCLGSLCGGPTTDGLGRYVGTTRCTCGCDACQILHDAAVAMVEDADRRRQHKDNDDDDDSYYDICHARMIQ